MIELLNKLFSAQSVSGGEKPVMDVIEAELAGACDEIKRDALGNLIAYKRGKSSSPRRVMLAAHADEIGFLVTFIDEKGFVRISPVGGINWVASAYSVINFENGTKGVLVPDADAKVGEYGADKFYVDIGCSDRESAEKLVKIGMRAAVAPQLVELAGGRIAGRPLDDKIGCAVLIEAMRRLEGNPDDVYCAFTVQEEVGCRGARTASYAVMPDISIACDVTGVGDTPGAKPMAVKLGGGAAIKIKDASVICSPELVQELTKVAEEKGIAHQHEILSAGGTDTSQMQLAGEGSVAGCISVPTRYIHSGVEMCDLADVEACVQLFVSYLSR
ncbi:MAG: M42 family metallopeptidase [Eubacteriales bacterium]|jgi:putative aminopeptidase FrvX|nr:M42 family metallopeptidase [Clostridiales bacterium]